MSHKIRPRNTTRAWRQQAPRAQKGHVLLLLGHLDVPAAKLRTLSLPNKTTDCSTVCNTRPGRSPGGFSVPTSPCVVPNTARFSRPSSAHFACNDHHPCSSFCPTQFRVPVLLPLPSVPQSHSIGCVCFPQRRSISMVRRHQCRVQSQLNSSKEGQTFCNHLQPARIRVLLRDVQVSHHDVGGHPGPAIATNLGDSTLHGITSPAEHPPPCRMLLCDGQRRQENGHKNRNGWRGQRQTEAAQQQHPERL